MQKPPFPFKGLLGKSIKTGPILASNLKNLEGFDVTVDGYEKENPGPTLITPIYNEEENAFAIIKVSNGINGTSFTQEDFNFLDTLCLVAYNSIKRSELFLDVKSAQERTDAALQISKAVSTEIETSKIISKIANVAKDVLKADRVSVFLVNRRNPNELIIEHSFDVRGVAIPITAGIAGSVATTGKTVNLIDAYDDDRFNQNMDSKNMSIPTSFLSLPYYFTN
jgi:adenylate cyclase